MQLLFEQAQKILNEQAMPVSLKNHFAALVDYIRNRST